MVKLYLDVGHDVSIGLGLRDDEYGRRITLPSLSEKTNDVGHKRQYMTGMVYNNASIL
jgi:hypothetical protein